MSRLAPLFFCFCFFLAQAQDENTQKLDSIFAIENVKVKTGLLEEFMLKDSSLDSLQKGNIYHQMALMYYQNGNYPKAIQHSNKALVFKESIRNSDAYNYQKSLNLLDASYDDNGELSMRLQTLYRMLAEKEETKFMRYALERFSDYYYDIGDYFKSIEYAQRIIRTYEIHEDRKNYLRALINVINAYGAMKSNDPRIFTEIEQHKVLMDQALDYFSAYQKIQYYNSLGLIYRTYDQKEQALVSYQKALENVEEETYQEDIHTLYANVGEMYSQLGETKNAHTYYQKVLSTTDSINISAVYNNLGYYHAKSIQEEIEWHQKGLQILEHQMGLSTEEFFPEEVKNTFYKEEFLFVLVDLSQAWIKKYQKTKNKENLEEALKILYRIDNFISVIRLNSRTKDSKLFWIDRGVNSYLEAVKVCFLLKKPEEAFYFMEKNKSLYLLEQLTRFRLSRVHKIPRELMEREEHLAYQLLRTKNRTQNNSGHQEAESQYQKSLSIYTKFADSLRLNFPELYKTPSNLALISLHDFQSFLQQQNAQAISYITGEKEGFGLWMTQKEVQLFRLENYSKLQTDVQDFKEVCSQPISAQEEVDTYKNLGRSIYQALFPFEKADSLIASKKLNIIPSGILYNLPFEALLVDQKSSLQENFLLQIAEVSYLNSASITQNLYHTERSNTYAYLGVAPVEFSSDELIDLNKSEVITKEVASLFDSQVKMRREASKKNFLELPEESQILHVNTHAGIDQRTQLPWIRMYDSLISLEELYVKSTPHDLVFLDACKTGDGTLQRGEGIESLSRAFFYSGSQSVIASRWNANEKATNEISLDFFKELQKGSSKSAALRQAKLNYLSNSQLSETLPYFWASLALTGNSEPLPPISNGMEYYWIFSFVFLSFVLILIRVKKKAKA